VPITSAVPATPAGDPPGADPTPAKPDSEQIAEALFSDAQALIKAKRDADARAPLASIGQLHATSSWFVPAMTVKISLEDRLHLREFDAIVGALAPASMATRRLLVEGAPQHPTAEAALWRLGEMYEDIKQYPLAAAAYVQLATRFPNTRYDAWFKAAEISERRVKNTKDAVRAYLRVPASSSRYRDAQNRAHKLGGR
jgi:tetratricopeptide (TPR) repeat protein